jgi:iron complex transport system substrate-binding protein
MTATRRWFVLFTAAWLPAACAPRERTPQSAAPTISDDWNRPVALPAPATRIVSLAPATTELAFALGLGGRLVGRTTWCAVPDSARLIPDVGNGLGPNVEAVTAQRPDLVLLYASESNRQALARFEALGIPVAVIKLDLAADIRRGARNLGALAGVRDRADSLVAAFDSALAAAAAHDTAAAGPPRPPLRVYIDIEGNPPLTIGAGSYLSEIVAAAGALNIFDDIRAPSGQVSLEAIVERDPDVVLVLFSDTTRVPRLDQRPGWRTVRAVRLGHVIALDGRLFGQPSPRMPRAVAELAAKLERMRRGGAAR